jgi:sulfonate transport system substrate-binding protein
LGIEAKFSRGMHKILRITAWAFAFMVPTITIAHAAAAAQPAVVRIATVAYQTSGKNTSIGAAAVIAKQGWLEKDLEKIGVRLEWVPVSPQAVAATINEAFANKSIDFAGYGDLPSVILNAGGVDTRLIVPGGNGNNVYLVVSPNSPAQSIRDLVGKRIALHRGRPWELAFARALAANGLKLSDFKISNLNPSAGSAALAAGNVDALVTLSDAYQLVDRNLGRIIWSTKKPGENWTMRAELWGARDFVAQYPEVTQIVANAYVRAAYWITRPENQAEFFAISAASGQPENVLRREYEGNPESWRMQWSPLFTPALADHYRYAATYSRESNLIRSELDTSRLLDPRFVAAAIKSLDLQGYWNPATASSQH